MDKAGGNAAKSSIESLSANDPVFFSAVSMAARDEMQKDVSKAMRAFAS